MGSRASKRAPGRAAWIPTTSPTKWSMAASTVATPFLPGPKLSGFGAPDAVGGLRNDGAVVVLGSPSPYGARSV